MVVLLREYIQDNHIIREYTKDGVSISHKTVEILPNTNNVPIETFPSLTIEQRVKTVEQTLNFILLGGI